MRSKRYKKLPEKTNLEKPNTIENLIPLVKKNCTTKFDESVDLSILINNKQKKNEINIRSAINLPSGTGKKVKIAVVAEDAKQKDAKDSGADLVGGDDLIDKIKNGELNFEKLICTPSMMIKLSKLGKILGPKGLMPNPKMGTVSDDLAKAVDKVKNKSIEVKNDKDGNLSFSIGRKSFQENKLSENIKSAFEFLKKEKSSIFNSENIKKVYFSTTMSPSFKLNFKDI